MGVGGDRAPPQEPYGAKPRFVVLLHEMNLVFKDIGIVTQGMISGVIYSISAKGSLPYYGSTIRKANERFVEEKSRYKRWKSGNKELGRTATFDLFEKYGIENCVVRIEEQHEWLDENELRMRERWYILTFPCVNICRAPLTKGRIRPQVQCEGCGNWYFDNYIALHRKRHMKQIRVQDQNFTFAIGNVTIGNPDLNLW